VFYQKQQASRVEVAISRRGADQQPRHRYLCGADRACWPCPL